ncbi:hypothetical protein ACOME3_009330 [Neoechinorhynchus agilis]
MKKLDKRACAAMHAVNLRHLLGCTCRTNRQEQNQESADFKRIFNNGINYVEGSHAESGFRVVYADGSSHNYDEQPHLQPMPARAFVISGTKHLDVRYAQVAPDSLNSKSVTLIDTNNEIYLWNGKHCNSVTRSKARLMAQTINAFDRNHMANIIQIDQGVENSKFLSLISNGSPIVCSKQIREKSSSNGHNYFVGKTPPIIYKLTFGRGGVHLVQPVRKSRYLSPEILRSENVYLCDCFGELYIWIGKASAKIARVVSLQLAKEIMNIFSRPKYYRICDVQQGSVAANELNGVVWIA